VRCPVCPRNTPHLYLSGVQRASIPHPEQRRFGYGATLMDPIHGSLGDLGLEIQYFRVSKVPRRKAGPFKLLTQVV